MQRMGIVIIGGIALAASMLLAIGGAASPQSPTPSDAAARAAWASACKDWDEWDKAGPPFRVYGNTYYVGTCGISSILIVGDQGDVLIDGGPPGAGDLIAANIRKLGFELSDVKILLHTHEHHDHAGGLARLKQLTGAKLYASPFAAKAFAQGGPNPEDPQFELHNPLPPVATDKVLQGDPTVTRGDLTLHGFATPGHTPGALSWQWTSCEGDACKTIVYADSMTPVSGDTYRFSDHPAYLAQFRASLDKVGALDCDILLAPHPSSAGMRDKLLAGDLAASPRCKEYADGLRGKLDERVAKEAADARK
jgi:metallo-beta-lactamase class B